MRYVILGLAMVSVGWIPASNLERYQEKISAYVQVTHIDDILSGIDLSQVYAQASTYDAYLNSNKLPYRMPATGGNVFVFDPKQFKYAAYNARGFRVKSGRASGGALWCPDVGRSCKTPRGIFKVFKKRGFECRSSKYPLGKGGSHMPYCSYFHQAGYAIHASNEVPKNSHASHGCIRLKPKEAYWLHRKFLDIGTTVVVRSY